MIEKYFRFEKTTGQFYWINPPKKHPDLLNKEAGSSQKSRGNKHYWVIQLNKKKYKAVPTAIKEIATMAILVTVFIITNLLYIK